MNADGIDFAPRLAAMILADEPPATLAEQTVATIHEYRPEACAQESLLDEASVALENGGFDEAATRLRDLRLAFALGPALYPTTIRRPLPAQSAAVVIALPDRGRGGSR